MDVVDPGQDKLEKLKDFCGCLTIWFNIGSLLSNQCRHGFLIIIIAFLQSNPRSSLPPSSFIFIILLFIQNPAVLAFIILSWLHQYLYWYWHQARNHSILAFLNNLASRAKAFTYFFNCCLSKESALAYPSWMFFFYLTFDFITLTCPSSSPTPSTLSAVALLLQPPKSCWQLPPRCELENALSKRDAIERGKFTPKQQQYKTTTTKNDKNISPCTLKQLRPPDHWSQHCSFPV